LFGLQREAITRAGKYPETVEARGVLCDWAVVELGFSALEISKSLGISQPTASQSIKHEEGLEGRSN
jgi:hypothetical protein